MFLDHCNIRIPIPTWSSGGDKSIACNNCCRTSATASTAGPNAEAEENQACDRREHWNKYRSSCCCSSYTYCSRGVNVVPRAHSSGNNVYVDSLKFRDLNELNNRKHTG
ncbi:uncharacterized protein LOC125502136 [Athalia rosae]|uniref:uncharacterized protein LOC125502136 n=1 Tax=Athalia rosae TaxID=37344 RepID=UPI002033B77A|nr:uncharacterized protein LOC125502136 [Athalia rosae]